MTREGVPGGVGSGLDVTEPEGETSPSSVAKLRMMAIIQDQPDDSSYEEILRELAFDRMIQRGLADAEAGRTLGDLEVRRRLRLWHSGRRVE